MSQPHAFAAALIALVLLPYPIEAAAGKPARTSERADRVRTLLRRHCVGCHGVKPRGGVQVLRLPQRDLKGRTLVVPGDPEGSLLFDLVAGGSMPPGRLPKLSAAELAQLRDWIKDGAPAFPPEVGRDYLLRRLVEDFGRLPKESKPHVRYLSLNHLTPDQAARQASALRAVLGQLSRGGKPLSEPVAADPTHTLLRIDLRDLGWDRRPFEKQTLNLFDLLLLEYPYGVLLNRPSSAELAEFLRQTRPVRPIPYLRVDWLVRAVLTEPMHGDFLTALERKAGPAPLALEGRDLPAGLLVSWDDAERELEMGPAVGNRLREVVGKIPDLAPLGRKATVPRSVWERHFPKVVRQLGLGTPILPLDGETWPEENADSSLQVEIRLVDPKDPGLSENPRAKDRFVFEKDQYRIWIHSNQDVRLELVITESQGHKRVQKVKGSPIIALNADKRFASMPATVKHPPGPVSFTLYVYPKKALAGAPYPAGTLMNRKGMRGRFVHPFYKPDDRKGRKEADPAKMVKITLPFTVVAE
jgi:hypothetical protein